MNPIEKYNNIINRIEELINEDPYTTPKNIIDTILNQYGICVKDLSVVIKFFTGMPAVTYIRNRKMNYSYKKLKNEKQFDVNKIISYTTYGDQSAYSKAFHKQFGMSPKTAFDTEEDLGSKPLTMEMLSSDVLEETVEDNQKQDKIFNIDRKLYERLLQANGYKELYGFTTSQGNVAYNLADSLEIPLKDAFQIIDDYCLYLEREYNICIKKLTEADLQSLTDQRKEMLNIAYWLHLSFTEICEMREEFSAIGVDIFEQDIKLLDLYVSGNLPVQKFWHNYNFFIDNLDQFEAGEIYEFLEATENYDCETAMEIVKEFRNPTFTDVTLEDIEDTYEDDKERDFYGNEYTDEPFHLEYDPDNPEYND